MVSSCSRGKNIMATNNGAMPLIDICALCGVSLEDHPDGLLCTPPPVDKDEEENDPRFWSPKPVHKGRGSKVYIKEED